MKSVQENPANKCLFMLTLWTPAKVKVSESGMKW